MLSAGRARSAAHRAVRLFTTHVAFATHSGKAAMLANQLADDLRSRGVDALAVDQQDVTLKTIAKTPKDDVWLFVNACFGKGEPTDSAKSLIHEINTAEDAPATFQDRSVGIFGLGASRSHAAHYQVVARELDTRLQQLGAVMVHERGEGDDSGDLFDDFDVWEEAILPHLVAKHAKGAAPPAKTAESDAANLQEFDYTAAAQRLGLGVPARVTRLERVSEADALRPVFHIRLTPADASALSYRAGDHLSILPHTLRHATRLVAGLGLSGAPAISAAAAVEFASPIPKPALRVLHGLASRGVHDQEKDADADPHRLARAQAQLAVIAACLETSKEGAARFNAYTRGAGVLSLADAVTDASDALCGHCTHSDLAALLAAMPQLRTRSYSIASAPKEQGGSADGSVSLLIRRVLSPKQDPMGGAGWTPSVTPADASAALGAAALEPGTCSAWVTGSEQSAALGHALEEDVMCGVRSADFGIPSDPAVPLFMIAGGVGLAPFLGFIEARQAVAERLGAGALGPAMLVRCSAVQSDLLLTERLQQALERGMISAVVDVVAALDGNVPDPSPLAPQAPPRIATSACRTIDQALVSDPAVSKFVREALCETADGQGFVCGGASGFGAAVGSGLALVLKDHWSMPDEAEARSTGSCRPWTLVDSIIDQGRWHEDLAD